MFGLGTVRGSLAVSDGRIVVAEPLEDSSVQVTVDVASFATANPKRDDKVRSSALLDAAAHPTMSFRSDFVERRDGAWVVHGQLTVRGTAAPVELGVTDVLATPGGLTATATGRVDRTTVGVTAMRGMVGRSLDLAAAVATTN
jgi:polyisoprenoid-binding protein YceI